MLLYDCSYYPLNERVGFWAIFKSILLMICSHLMLLNVHFGDILTSMNIRPQTLAPVAYWYCCIANIPNSHTIHQHSIRLYVCMSNHLSIHPSVIGKIKSCTFINYIIIHIEALRVDKINSYNNLTRNNTEVQGQKNTMHERCRSTWARVHEWMAKSNKR